MDFAPNADQKIQYSIYILRALLPFLKHLNEEHIKETEAKFQGIKNRSDLLLVIVAR